MFPPHVAPCEQAMAEGWRQWRHARRPIVAYALMSGGPAAITPFAALWLHGHGIALSMLGICLAVPLMLRPLVAGPLTAWVARFASPWTPIAILGAIATLAAGLGAGLTQKVACLVIWAIINLAFGICTPILDTIILTSSAGKPGDPGLARAKSAGALAFLSGSLGIGFALGRMGPAAIMLWAGVTGVVAVAYCAVSALQRPEGTQTILEHGQPGEPSRAPAVRGSLSLALIAAALIEASHGLHAVAMIGWKARGLGPELNGALWATGTLCDVLFLWLAGRWCDRIGPSRLMMLGAAAAVLRWSGFALAPSLPVLFLLQGLHALSFTATCLASVRIAQMLAYRHARLRYQILSWATSTGLAHGLAVVMSGPLYLALGARGYWVMAGLAGLGLAVAMIFHQRFAEQAAKRATPHLRDSKSRFSSLPT